MNDVNESKNELNSDSVVMDIAINSLRNGSVNIKKEIQELQAKANDRASVLNSILNSAYRLYLKVESADEQEGAQYLGDLAEMLSESGISDNSKKTYTRIIRLIFNESEMDRQKISTYGNVLKNAALDDVQADEFLNWLQNVGGINKASRLKSESKHEDDIAEALSDLQLIEEVAIISDSSIASHIENNDFEFKLAFCHWDSATGELTIYRIIENEDKVKASFKPFAKEISDDATRISKLKSIEEKRRKRQVKIESAAMEACNGYAD